MTRGATPPVDGPGEAPRNSHSPRGEGLFRAALREPLVHFAIAGGVLFAVHARLERPSPDAVVITAPFVQALRDEQRERTGKAPSEEETRDLVERWVDEEVLYREALAQGLDRGDLIVRRRLLQKMELVARARVAEPSDAELRAYLAAHEDRYRTGDTLSFRHVFVSRDRHGEGALARARELRSLPDPEKEGDPFVAGASFARRTRADLTSTFGPSFVEGAFSAPIDAWSEPIPSSYGFHLVRVSAREGGAVPDLAAVRARVHDDLVSERRASALRDEVARLRKKYAITIEPH